MSKAVQFVPVLLLFEVGKSRLVDGEFDDREPVQESPYGDAEDTGQCLSMHQPWASMLVYGFKRAEGRQWKTDHRGRLWIHATSKAPDLMEIQALEERYASIYQAAGVPMPPFPSSSGGYPTSALLGCVDVEACWSQSEQGNPVERGAEQAGRHRR
eukprot:Skav236709  [mRNA]  locus=scaffold738:364773:375405:- [translate_table: standard]